MTSSLEVKKYEGCIVGLACGDALGYPTEFMSMQSIRAMYGVNGIQDLEQARTMGQPPRVALYTDDTQMTLAVARGLIRAGAGATCDDAAPHVVDEFVSWSNDPPGGHRAPGGACMGGCRRLALGAPWEQAGGPNDGGCGSVMRSAPYGLFFQNEEDAIACAARHSCMTHRASLALAASAALASGVWNAVRGMTKVGIAQRMIEVAGRYDEVTRDMLRRDADYADNAVLGDERERQRSVDSVLDRRRGWAGHEAIAGSLFCFLVADDYVTAVRYGANSPGDSDSLACIAGALAGAFYGIDAVPSSWVEIIERREELLLAARELHKLATVDGGTPNVGMAE